MGYCCCQASSRRQGCSPALRTSATQGGLYFWSYVYYLSKYYELLDTVLLILKVRRRSWAPHWLCIPACRHYPPSIQKPL